MARIRSQHPGQWTDEDFVQMSPMARLLTLAIRNEADDQGVFEWKPVTIKMRLMPADAVDIVELLAEMEAHNQVMRFEHSGKQYGVVRNFGKFQRPKKPTNAHPLPSEFRTYAGLTADSSPPVPHQFPTTTEDRPQRKEEGGREVSKSSDANASGADAPDDQWIFGTGMDWLRTKGGQTEKQARGMVGRWRKDGHTDAAIRQALTEAIRCDPAEPVAYVTRLLVKPVKPAREPPAAVATPPTMAGANDEWLAKQWNAGRRNYPQLNSPDVIRRLETKGLIPPPAGRRTA